MGIGNVMRTASVSSLLLANFHCAQPSSKPTDAGRNRETTHATRQHASSEAMTSEFTEPQVQFYLAEYPVVEWALMTMRGKEVFGSDFQLNLSTGLSAETLTAIMQSIRQLLAYVDEEPLDSVQATGLQMAWMSLLSLDPEACVVKPLLPDEGLRVVICSSEAVANQRMISSPGVQCFADPSMEATEVQLMACTSNGVNPFVSWVLELRDASPSFELIGAKCGHCCGGNKEKNCIRMCCDGGGSGGGVGGSTSSGGTSSGGSSSSGSNCSGSSSSGGGSLPPAGGTGSGSTSSSGSSSSGGSSLPPAGRTSSGSTSSGSMGSGAASGTSPSGAGSMTSGGVLVNPSNSSSGSRNGFDFTRALFPEIGSRNPLAPPPPSH